MVARDSRFDGVFFVAVSTTGIYCRPICSARTPGRDRVRFFRTPAEAEGQGYRACFRCRPELAPGQAPLDSIPRLVARATRAIDEGYLNERSVDDLAFSLGVTGRHLRRAMEAEIGVTPVELAQSRRLALAKQLLHDSRAGLAEIAFASGFQSVRRFNTLFRERFGRTPSSVRHEHGTRRAAPGEREPLTLRLGYRPPFDWASLLEFLHRRAVPGVEGAGDGEYRRTVFLDGHAGVITVAHDPRRSALLATVSPSLAGSLMAIAARLRALFDLDAHPASISQAFARDPVLGPLVARRPGLRVAGSFEPFEAAVRAILGQQVTVRAATTLAGRFAARFGSPLAAADGAGAALTHLFPAPERIGRATVDEIASLGIVGARARAILALARNVCDGTLKLDRSAPVDDTLRALEDLPGVGAWTAQYVAMRTLRWPDAFPASDIAVRKALGGVTAREAERRSEPWRPWRSYAVLHLWTSLGDPAEP